MFFFHIPSITVGHSLVFRRLATTEGTSDPGAYPSAPMRAITRAAIRGIHLRTMIASVPELRNAREKERKILKILKRTKNKYRCARCQVIIRRDVQAREDVADDGRADEGPRQTGEEVDREHDERKRHARASLVRAWLGRGAIASERGRRRCCCGRARPRRRRGPRVVPLLFLALILVLLFHEGVEEHRLMDLG
jgi:hypothetical protein